MTDHRKAVRALAAASLACAALASVAQPRSTDPVRIIVAAPAGGGTDTLFRGVAAAIAPQIGAPVAVLNAPGGGGAVGVTQLARAAPDGKTLGAIVGASVTTVPHTVGGALKYDDIEPVVQMSSAPYVYCVSSTFPANTGAELIAELKRNSGKYTYGTDGVGGIAQMATERILAAVGTRATDVPFKGAGETIVGLLGNHIDIYVGSIPPALQHVRSGRIKCPLLTSASEVAALPGASGLRAVGLEAHEMVMTRVLLAPKGTPPETVRQLADAVEAATQSPALRQMLTDASEQVNVLKGEALRRSLAREYEETARLARQLGLKPQ